MKKALLLENQEPALKELHDKYQEKHTALKQRMEFIKKQVEGINKERDGLVDKLNFEVEALCRSRGLLPEGYDPKKHHFHFEHGALVLCDEETRGLDIRQIITGIFE